jgi:holo-[acyl-carrier protein] synthase
VGRNNLSVRVGIDLVAVEQIGESIASHGDRFLERVYTPSEREASGGDPSRLAERFAAKEATMKALGRTGEGFGWRSIEVVSDCAGGHRIRLSDGAAALARGRGVESLSVSLTRHRDTAAALVLAGTTAPQSSEPGSRQ